MVVLQALCDEGLSRRRIITKESADVELLHKSLFGGLA